MVAICCLINISYRRMFRIFFQEIDLVIPLAFNVLFITALFKRVSSVIVITFAYGVIVLQTKYRMAEVYSVVVPSWILALKRNYMPLFYCKWFSLSDLDLMLPFIVTKKEDALKHISTCWRLK
jgi:hypothetical protein